MARIRIFQWGLTTRFVSSYRVRNSHGDTRNRTIVPLCWALQETLRFIKKEPHRGTYMSILEQSLRETPRSADRDTSSSTQLI